MRRLTHGLGSVAIMVLCACAIGCSSDNPLGSMGGNLIGDAAGNMLSGNAQKKAEQQQKQALAQQQQQQQQLAAQQAAGSSYKAPAMEMTGTLTEKKATDGTATGWTFAEQQSSVSTAVDVKAVEKDARKLAGKRVTLTGRYDTLGTGAFVVEKVAAVTE